MPSKYGFVTKDEDREIRRREEEERQTRARLIYEQLMTAAQSRVKQINDIVLDILMDYAHAREWQSVAAAYSDLEIRISGNAQRGNTGYYPILISVHVPLTEEQLLYLVRPENWQAGHDDNLESLAQVIADTTGVTTWTTELVKGETLDPDDNTRPGRRDGEYRIREFIPIQKQVTISR